MSQSLIAVGTGVAACAGTIALSCYLGSVSTSVVVTSIAVGILGLKATQACKDDNSQALNQKDYIIIGGASVVGAAAGGTAVKVVATVIYGAMVGSMIGSLVGNMIFLPFNILSCFVPRPIYYPAIYFT